jgi:D-alanyl-D-alanine carboxypeptidase
MFEFGRKLAFVAAIALAAIFLPVWKAEARYAAIIVEADSGAVIYERNADKRRHPASLTKIMTLYLTFEALKAGKITLDTRFTVSKRAAGQAPSRLGLRRGKTIRVKDAIQALVTKSANDVATVVAEGLAGSEIEFAKLMTARAKQLGMTRTRFANASGLYNRRQLSTARDMVKLARALQSDFPEYYHYFSTRTFRYGKNTYRNHNRLLGRYAGTDGIKTGYIGASGFNLVASVQRNDFRLIGVVFGGRSSGSRDRHMMKLLDRGFSILKAQRPRTAALPPLPQPKPKLIAATGERQVAPKQSLPARRSSHVAAVPGPAESGSASADQEATIPWGIQIGAFKHLVGASKRVKAATRVLPDLLGKANIDIQPVKGNDTTLYRVRMTGLSEREARASCSTLKRKKVSCVVIAAGREALPTAAD